jgi:hypothetical protein
MANGSHSGDNVVDFVKRPTIRIEPIVEDVQEGVVKVLPLLAASIRKNERNSSMEDVVSDLLEGRSLAWAVYMQDTLIAAFTTCVMRHPQRHTLYIEYMGGADMSIWMNAAINVLKDLAQKSELSAIEADGRIGFSRYAKDNGFSEKYRHFEMEL